jgi:Protein of unknown function (DUF4012)
LRIFSRRPFSDEPYDDDDDDILTDNDERPPWYARRGALLGGVVVLAVVVAFGCWLGIRAYSAKTSLEDARHSAQQTKDALLQGKSADASRFASEAASHAEAAREDTHSLPWNIASAVPWLGSPFKTGQQISDVVLSLASDVLEPSAQAGTVLAPDKLLVDGRLDVQTLREEEPALTKLASAAMKLDEDAKAINDPAYLSVIQDARSQVQAQTSNVAQLLNNTALASRLAPAMMGADGPRSYFMGFQTNAEARGTGGLLGGWGILRFNDGKATVDTLGPNTTFGKVFAPTDLGPEFETDYGFSNPTTDIRNTNQSSHFPYAAQIWKSLWAQESGENVDGAIAIDPIALSYILGAVGPVTMPDGEEITQENVVELTESTVYSRFPDDQVARKQYLQDIATEVVRKVTGKVKSPRKLLDALGKAVSERRISVWSATPADQELLEKTPLAHVIPDDPAPYAEVVINNLGGNKMDYYLDRQIEYVADKCDGDTRMSTVTVRLANTLAPTDVAPLPDYVVAKEGFTSKSALNVPKGTMLTSVRLLATAGAKLISATTNGTRVPAFQVTERGHPSFVVQVSIPPGKSGELTFRLSEPTAPGAARVPVQPLVGNVAPKVEVPECVG